MEILNVGIIGAGRIGHVHAKSITHQVSSARVAWIADPFLGEEQKAWAKEFGIPNVGKDPQAILDDPSVDAIIICSSTDTHAKFIKEGAAAGKHIFCEKPVDPSPAVIREAIAVVEKAGVKLQIGFNRRFDHNYIAIRKAIVDETIGDLQMVRITSRDPSPPPVSYIKVSGGLFMDMMIHDFDMARFLSGREVVEVYAAGGVLVDKAIGEAGDVDSAIVTLKFENGALGVIENCRQAVYGYDQRAEVLGTKGAAVTENDKASTVQISTEQGVISEKPLLFFLERYMDAYCDEMKAFVKAIINDEEPLVTGVDGLQPVLIAEAALESARTGLPVKVATM